MTPQGSESEDQGWDGARDTFSAGSRSLPTPSTVDTFQVSNRICIVIDLRTLHFSASPAALPQAGIIEPTSPTWQLRGPGLSGQGTRLLGLTLLASFFFFLLSFFSYLSCHLDIRLFKLADSVTNP